MSHLLECHSIVKTDFVDAKNCFLYDASGKKYIDFESGIWCTVLGHNHPEVNAAILSQLNKVSHIGTRYPNDIVEEAAMIVLSLVGIDHGKATFLCSGSEAVEMSAQAIRRISKKPLLMTFANSYLAAFGSAGKKSVDDWYLLDWNECLDRDAQDWLARIPFSQIGGFVFEPGGSGSAFVRFPPKEIVHSIVRKIKEYGGWIISNEVTTGIGRTGRWFGFQHYGLQPDIVALGKGLGNGYPVSAVVMRQEIAEKLVQEGFYYAQSHQNDPLGAAVATSVINVLQKERWIEKGSEKGAEFLCGLQRVCSQFSAAKEARGRGMLLALELDANAGFSCMDLYYDLLNKGFLTGYYPAGRILRFDPALTMETENFAHLLSCLIQILKERERE